MEMGKEPDVKTAANVFRELCYNYRDSLTAGIIVAGWDSSSGGQVWSLLFLKLFLVDVGKCVAFSPTGLLSFLSTKHEFCDCPK